MTAFKRKMTAFKREGRTQKTALSSTEVCEEHERIITQKIGSGPILKHFIERMGITKIIDSIVETHSQREALTHGYR